MEPKVTKLPGIERKKLINWKSANRGWRIFSLEHIRRQQVGAIFVYSKTEFRLHEP